MRIGMPQSSEDDFRQAIASFQAGRLNDAEQSFKGVLQRQPKHAAALNLLSVLLTQLKRYDEAEHYIKLALEIGPPSDATFYNYGIILNALNRPREALDRFNDALAINPSVADTWNNCGVVLNELQRYEEAIAKFERAIDLQPNYAEAFYNKGKSLTKLSRYGEAAAAYDKAIALKPNLAEAWFGRSDLFFKTMRYDEARTACQRALTCKPDFVEALFLLAHLALSEGNISEALGFARRALSLGETTEAKTLVALCLNSPLLHPDVGDLRDLLLRALSEAWMRASDLTPTCNRFLALNDTIREGMARAARAWPQLLTAEDWLEPSRLMQLAGDRFFLALLECAPVSEVALERFATGLRASLLKAAAPPADSAMNEPAVSLFCALARQCFIGNYVFSESDAEREQVRSLQGALVAAIGAGDVIPVLWLVAVAAYVPLHTLPGAESLLERTWPDAVAALLAQQIRAPLEEKRLRSSMPVLTRIDDDVSIQVRQQYEENPYPQWTKVPLAGKAEPVDALMREKFPLSKYVDLAKDGDVDILVAGCGTGQQSIDTARVYQGARVLAIDLSLSSLCYAHRQTRALGLENIQYAQADIMKLQSLGRTFDVIEVGGVLHHLADPLAGWRVLLSLLRARGIMRLGLYSDVARRDIVAVRDFIAERGYNPTTDDIRRCRQELLNCPDGTPFKNVTLNPDFFSVSGCRDLLFHVQEHRLTLPVIAAFLEDNNLEFLGFDIDLQTGRDYLRQFPADPAMTNLAQWHIFETEHPHTFAQMYQFRVQKK